jgi:hypothetical protein
MSLLALDKNPHYIKFGYQRWLLIVIILALSLLTVNGLATFCAMLFLVLAAKLLYRENEPPLLFLAIFFQWLQVSVKLFYADFYALPFESVFRFPDYIYEAYYLSLLGLLGLCVGIWFVMRTVPVARRAEIAACAQEIDTRKITAIYIFAILATPFLIKLGLYAGGLQQFVQKFSHLKWSLFFLFFLATFLKDERKRVFYFIAVVELLLAFTGFFSSFKDYFMVLAIGYLMVHQKVTVKQTLVMGILCIILFNFFVVWQHVKMEYRTFLTGGEKTQRVKVSKLEALDKLSNLVANMDTAGYRDGVNRLIERTSYIDFFSASIAYVPKYHEHENGKLWWTGITHVLTPRILFPNKASIDDSQVAMRYTGLKFATAKEGASVTLGYMGETYVDFGRQYMILPLLIFGLLIGLIYRYFLLHSPNVLWGYALLIPLFFQLNVFEQALIKLIGGTIAYFLVFFILKKIGFLSFLHRKVTISNPEV